MKKKAVTKNTVALAAPLAFDALLGQVRTLIQEARQQALRAVAVGQVSSLSRRPPIQPKLKVTKSESPG